MGACQSEVELEYEMELLLSKFQMKISDLQKIRKAYKSIQSEDKPLDFENFKCLFMQFEHSPLLLKLFECKVDKNSQLNEASFIDLIATFSLYDIDEILTFTFHLYDENNDKEISETEFKNFIRDLVITQNPELICDDFESKLPPKYKKVYDAFEDEGRGVLTLNQFNRITRKYAYVLWPLYRLQFCFHDKILGSTYWKNQRDIVMGNKKQEYLCCFKNLQDQKYIIHKISLKNGKLDDVLSNNIDYFMHKDIRQETKNQESILKGIERRKASVSVKLLETNLLESKVSKEKEQEVHSEMFFRLNSGVQIDPKEHFKKKVSKKAQLAGLYQTGGSIKITKSEKKISNREKVARKLKNSRSNSPRYQNGINVDEHDEETVPRFKGEKKSLSARNHQTDQNRMLSMDESKSLSSRSEGTYNRRNSSHRQDRRLSRSYSPNSSRRDDKKIHHGRRKSVDITCANTFQVKKEGTLHSNNSYSPHREKY